MTCALVRNMEWQLGYPIGLKSAPPRFISGHPRRRMDADGTIVPHFVKTVLRPPHLVRLRSGRGR